LKLVGAAVNRSTYTLFSDSQFENIAELLKGIIESDMRKWPIRIKVWSSPTASSSRRTIETL
jgi:hypothetical protein